MTATLMFASDCLSFSGLWVWVCWHVWAFTTGSTIALYLYIRRDTQACPEKTNEAEMGKGRDLIPPKSQEQGWQEEVQPTNQLLIFSDGRNVPEDVKSPLKTGQGGRRKPGGSWYGQIPHTNTHTHALPACKDLDGNRLTSQIDELAAGHPAAGCFHPDCTPCVKPAMSDELWKPALVRFQGSVSCQCAPSVSATMQDQI